MTGAATPHPAVFDDLMAEVMASAERFGHREHVHLAWLAVRRVGAAAAVALIADGIRRTARYQGAPQKYHATVTRVWVELVAHHASGSDATDFATFAGQHPGLFDKRLLSRFYHSATLASQPARTGWVPPDLAPLPGSPFPIGHSEERGAALADSRPGGGPRR